MKCNCVLTMADIALEASRILGRKVNVHTVQQVRAQLAQQHCDAAFSGKAKDWEGGCIKNPYLPTRTFGGTYGFSKARAQRIVRAVIARSKSVKSRSAVRRWRGKVTAFAFA